MHAFKLVLIKRCETQTLTRETYPSWCRWFFTLDSEILSSTAISTVDFRGSLSSTTLILLSSISTDRLKRTLPLRSKFPLRNLLNHFWHTRSRHTRCISFYVSPLLFLLFENKRVKCAKNAPYYLPYFRRRNFKLHWKTKEHFVWPNIRNNVDFKVNRKESYTLFQIIFVKPLRTIKIITRSYCAKMLAKLPQAIVKVLCWLLVLRQKYKYRFVYTVNKLYLNKRPIKRSSVRNATRNTTMCIIYCL